MCAPSVLCICCAFWRILAIPRRAYFSSFSFGTSSQFSANRKTSWFVMILFSFCLQSAAVRHSFDIHSMNEHGMNLLKWIVRIPVVPTVERKPAGRLCTKNESQWVQNQNVDVVWRSNFGVLRPLKRGHDRRQTCKSIRENQKFYRIFQYEFIRFKWSTDRKLPRGKSSIFIMN